ncbi:hypothetical protein V2G26_006881 [Clonostachys chloroleuca]
MSSETDLLKSTSIKSMREAALEAGRDDAILGASHLSQAAKDHNRRPKRAIASLTRTLRVTKRHNYAEPSDEDDGLLHDADDESEKEMNERVPALSKDGEVYEKDAGFVVEDGSDEAISDDGYATEAESEGGSSKSMSGSQDLEESENDEMLDIGDQELSVRKLLQDIPSEVGSDMHATRSPQGISTSSSEADYYDMQPPSEIGGCPHGTATLNGERLTVWDLKGYFSMDGVRFPKRFARKSKIAEHSVGLYHFAAGVMTEEDLKTLRLELIEYNLFIPKDVRDDLSQFRIIKRKDTASRVDLFLIDCLFPGNPEIQDFRQDVGSRLEDEPYPAVMVPKSVTLIKWNDMTNIVIENDRYIIPVTRSSSQDNTHALQEETQPGIVRDTPQSNQPEQNQQSLAGPPQTEPPSTALPRQQPPSMESLRAGLRQEQWIEPSPAGPLPRTLSQQRPTLEESLLATMQSEPSTRALPVTRSPGPQPWPGNGPQSQMFTGQAPMNPRFSSHLLSNDHIYRRVSNPNSLGSFSDSTNAMRPKGPLQRPLDLEQRSHQRSMTSEQQMNDEQTSRARGVDDVQNPTHKGLE